MSSKGVLLIALVAVLAALSLLLVFSCTNPKDPVDSQRPTVTLTSPANGSVVPNTVDVLADAQDNVGVTKVEFFVDAELYFTDLQAPWSCCWTATVEHAGEHTIFAKAHDAAGNWDCSEAVAVNCAITPPATITDLTVSNPDVDGTATLNWTAPGDDGNTGTAAEYDLRYYWTAISADNWASAVQVDGEPTPQAAGSLETFEMTGLMLSRSYYFAIRTRDAAGNWSEVSASVSVETANLFLPAVTYPVSSRANDMVLTDVDGDSDLDLVVSHLYRDSAVQTLYNDGNGVFQAGSWYPSYAAPTALTVVDIDNDDDSDLVLTTGVANYYTIVRITCVPLPAPLIVSTLCGGRTTKDTLYADCDTIWDTRSVVSTLENLGGGTFRLNHLDTVVDTTYRPCQGIILPCLPDQGPSYMGMCCNTYYSQICDDPGLLFYWDSLFFDSTVTEQWAGRLVSAVTSADFNSDGHFDIAVANYNENTLGVLRNAGDGTLLAPVTYEGRARPGSIATGDFNGDGFVDLVMAASALGQLATYINQGNGSFVVQPSIPVPTSPSSLCTADCNGDGRTDIIMSSGDQNVVGILFGNGNGTFAPVRTYQAGRGPSAMCAADFDGDNAPDLAVANANGNDICVLINQGLFMYYSYNTVYIDVGQHPIAICSGDLDGDGDNDLVVLNDESNEVSVLINAR